LIFFEADFFVFLVGVHSIPGKKWLQWLQWLQKERLPASLMDIEDGVFKGTALVLRQAR